MAAAALWLVASGLFSWYAASFGTFNQTYGSLGAVIGFMTWLWISAIAILLSAEFDAEMEHQTERDTTTGRPKPIGTRGREWPTQSVRDKAVAISDACRPMMRIWKDRLSVGAPSPPGNIRLVDARSTFRAGPPEPANRAIG